MNYPKYYFILAPKDILQMSTSTFKGLFEFLIQFTMPDYTLKVDSNNPLQTVLFELLKKMNYQGPLNKSHFQTIGGFNLSHNLGVLHFLWTLAKLSIGICDDFSRGMNWLYFKTKIALFFNSRMYLQFLEKICSLPTLTHLEKQKIAIWTFVWEVKR